MLPDFFIILIYTLLTTTKCSCHNSTSLYADANVDYWETDMDAA